MTIKNQTPVHLRVMESNLAPYSSREYGEVPSGTLHIHSEIGSCIITTKDDKLHFETFGNLGVKEASKKNKKKERNIIVRSIAN